MAQAEGSYSRTLIANYVFNAFLSYTAIMLDIITIHVLRKTSSLPKPLKTLLLSVAVSDLGVGLLFQPLYIAQLVMEVEQNTHNNDTYKAINIAYVIHLSLFCYASFFGVVALSADRFLTIHFHLRYQELVTHKRVVAVVISIWVISAFLSLIDLVWIPEKVKSIIFITIEAVCYITTAFLYCKIYAAVRRHTNQIQALQVQQPATNGELTNARLRKTAVGTFYVYLVFLVCNLPLTCVNIAFLISGDSTNIHTLWDYAVTLMFLNSSLNPLIYCWKMRHIRHAVLDMLRNIFRADN